MINKTLYQSWKNTKLPKYFIKNVNRYKETNQNINFVLMDDTIAENFIMDKLGEEVYRLYLLLPQPIMRADFWRVAVIYFNGGIYSDLDVVCNISLDSIIEPNLKALFITEGNNIGNFFFAAEKEHPALKMALDYMICELKDTVHLETQAFGMHNLHRAVREYYNIQDTNYASTDEVKFISMEFLRDSNQLIHQGASFMNIDGYASWRALNAKMLEDRDNANSILFFTTFNANGYELYGKTWVNTFISIANYYGRFKAKIYYEDFKPDIFHPNIEWLDFKKEIKEHSIWKSQYNERSKHYSDYVRKMGLRFSYKAFVIKKVLLEENSYDYLVWLDGDAVFKNSDFINFPNDILDNKFMACQVELAPGTNHIESGILIFDGKSQDTKKFAEILNENYKLDTLLLMGEPYDGFVIYKTLEMLDVPYVNLNSDNVVGRQSDPDATFLHPKIKSRFKHNIGWTGKNQYEKWADILKRDYIYQAVQLMLFGKVKESDAEIIARTRSKANKIMELRLKK